MMKIGHKTWNSEYSKDECEDSKDECAQVGGTSNHEKKEMIADEHGKGKHKTS